MNRCGELSPGSKWSDALLVGSSVPRHERRALGLHSTSAAPLTGKTRVFGGLRALLVALRVIRLVRLVGKVPRLTSALLLAAPRRRPGLVPGVLARLSPSPCVVSSCLLPPPGSSPDAPFSFVGGFSVRRFFSCFCYPLRASSPFNMFEPAVLEEGGVDQLLGICGWTATHAPFSVLCVGLLVIPPRFEHICGP